MTSEQKEEVVIAFNYSAIFQTPHIELTLQYLDMITIFNCILQLNKSTWIFLNKNIKFIQKLFCLSYSSYEFGQLYTMCQKDKSFHGEIDLKCFAKFIFAKEKVKILFFNNIIFFCGVFFLILQKIQYKIHFHLVEQVELSHK